VRKWVGTLALIACAGLGSGVAVAATVEYETVFKKFEVEVESGGGDVKGKLDSHKRKCLKKRKVTAYRKYRGDKHKLGSDKTNKKGKWRLSFDTLKVGKYYAKVGQKDIGPNSAGEDQVCASAKSGKVDVS
jgi:hypothetical protein